MCLLSFLKSPKIFFLDFMCPNGQPLDWASQGGRFEVLRLISEKVLNHHGKSPSELAEDLCIQDAGYHFLKSLEL